MVHTLYFVRTQCYNIVGTIVTILLLYKCIMMSRHPIHLDEASHGMQYNQTLPITYMYMHMYTASRWHFDIGIDMYMYMYKASTCIMQCERQPFFEPWFSSFGNQRLLLSLQTLGGWSWVQRSNCRPVCPLQSALQQFHHQTHNLTTNTPWTYMYILYIVAKNLCVRP